MHPIRRCSRDPFTVVECLHRRHRRPSGPRVVRLAALVGAEPRNGVIMPKLIRMGTGLTAELGIRRGWYG